MLKTGYKRNINQRNAELLLNQTQKFSISSNQVFLQFLAPTQKQWGACSVYQHGGIYLTPLKPREQFRNLIAQQRLKGDDTEKILPKTPK